MERILGPPKFDDDLSTRTGIPGVAMGLAFTAFGGDVLFIEASKYAGNGAVHITGNLGDVMKESCSIALAWVRAHAVQLGLTKDFSSDPIPKRTCTFTSCRAIPKDDICWCDNCNRARITIHRLSGTKRHSYDWEISLRGVVMPVGGVKEKVTCHKLSPYDMLSYLFASR